MRNEIQKPEGTIVWIAPFYNRSGYGIGARAAVSALHREGIQIGIVFVDEIEPGIDDSDINLIRSLERTPIIPPVTLIISHVPSKNWLNIKLPEPNIRIISTTFDSSIQGNKPPKDWIDIFKEFDQIWLQTYTEMQVFIEAGVPEEKIKIVFFPNPWKDNIVIPPPSTEYMAPDKPFRFLSIAMFQPRRRWDILIEAYLEEFRTDENVELYLKVNYPSWHPVQGKPKQDLHNLIKSLRLKTGSYASIIIDEELGTRRGIVDLIDSCNIYVSTDTTSTAPIAEARVRNRLVIVPYGIDNVSKEAIQVEIEVDPDAKFPLTEDMLLYQPHHRDAFMPQLHVKDVRNALRKAFNMSVEERQIICQRSAACIPGPKDTIPNIINCIKSGWEYKRHQQNKACNITWEGPQFSCSSLALINRELCKRIINDGFNLSIKNVGGSKSLELKDFEFLKEHLDKDLNKVDIHISHQFPPNLISPKSGYWVVIQPWEYGSLPIEWVGIFSSKVNELWVPSTYVKQVYVESGVPEKKVFVIPNGFDPEKFSNSVKPYELKTRKSFKFLFIGGTIYRKGIDVLLDTYISTFKKSDDVCLVIKDMGGDSFYKGQSYKEKILEIIQNGNSPEIEYIDEILTEQQLGGLYTACNILVHPYRGEGFGLPVLEAMACGLPVIVTEGGACNDFCSSDNSIFILSEKVYYKDKKVGDLETISNPWLYEPDKNDLKTKMLYAFQHTSVIKELGKKALEHVHTNFTWDKAYQKLKRRIKMIKDSANSAFGKNSEDMFIASFKNFLQAYDAGEFQEASKFIESAIVHFNTSPRKGYENIEYKDLLNLAGTLYLSMNDFEKAQNYFEEELNNNPTSARACIGLGEVFFSAEMYNEAKTMFEWAVNNEPLNNTAASGLAKVNRQLGLTDLHNNLQGEEYNPEQDIIEAEELIKQDDFNGAQLILENILLKCPENLDALNNLAVARILKGEHNKALDLIEKVLEIDENNEIALENLKYLSNILNAE